MNRTRFLLGWVFGVVAALVLSEGILRLMPVSSGARMQPTDEHMPISRYLPNQSYVYSYGWAMVNARQGVTNKHGFPNSADSVDPSGILVVGDSFIESLMLDYRETVQGNLEPWFPHHVSTVSASGNNLADALQIVRHFGKVLRPSMIVIFVEPTDLSGLLDKPSRGHSGFSSADGQKVSLVHAEYAESPRKELLLRSALARYFYYNLRIQEWMANAWPSRTANNGAIRPQVRLEKSPALRFLLTELRTLADEERYRLVFLLDGDRKHIYSGGAEKSWDDDDRSLFVSMASASGFDIIDMQPIFEGHWKTRRERLDFLPMDGHWNPVAHRLAADEVIRLLRP